MISLKFSSGDHKSVKSYTIQDHRGRKRYALNELPLNSAEQSVVGITGKMVADFAEKTITRFLLLT